MRGKIGSLLKPRVGRSPDLRRRFSARGDRLDRSRSRIVTASDFVVIEERGLAPDPGRVPDERQVRVRRGRRRHEAAAKPMDARIVASGTAAILTTAVSDASAWRGGDFAGDESWILRLSDAAITGRVGHQDTDHTARTIAVLYRISEAGRPV